MTVQSANLWENIVLSCRAPICVFDTEFRLIAFNQPHNDEFFRVNGYYTKIGDIFPDLFVPEQGAVMRSLMARALSGEVFTVVEEFGNPVLNNPYWEISYAPLRNGAGDIVGAFHMAQDVSARLRAEAALSATRDIVGKSERLETLVAERTKELRESRARLRTMFETSFGFQGLLSKSGIVLDANATALAAIDQPLASVVGRPFWDTPWFSSTSGIADFIRDALKQVLAGGTVRREILIDLPVGGWRWFDFAMRPIRDEMGTIVALAAEGIETTERRRAEEALRQSQKLEAMGQLTGGVAHDFNNLLTPIIGGLDMLARRNMGTERERRLIDGALQSAERAKTLVQRLLAFARRQPLQPAAIDLPQLILGMVELISSTTGSRIQLDLDFDDGLPTAKADANQLEMAILNIAVNARDAMPDGGRLTISVTQQSVDVGDPMNLFPGRYIRLAFVDTGVGMDRETLERAIEPFFSTKGIGKGTGLGLSMVHGLASQLGGTVLIKSQLNEGTTIEVWLPASDEKTADSAVSSDGGVIHRALGTALVVDDEPLVRMSTADMLQEFGYQVVEAGSAEEAIELFDNGFAADVLVTDHIMPGMTGVDLARRLRASRPDMPVLIVSGYAKVDGIAGDLPRLTKPFRQSELADMLSSVTTGFSKG